MKYLLVALVMFCGSISVSEAAEMSIVELLADLEIICLKNSSALWQAVISCHSNISDQFLRSSDEANCPRTSSDPDPTNTSVPMIRVFQTLCNAVSLNPLTVGKSVLCLGVGHTAEVATVKQQFGQNVPSDLVTCIRAIDFSKF